MPVTGMFSDIRDDFFGKVSVIETALPIVRRIDGLIPMAFDMGYVGTLTISGVGFGAVKGDNYVLIGSIEQSILTWSDTSIVVQCSGSYVPDESLEVYLNGGVELFTASLNIYNAMRVDGIDPVAVTPDQGGSIGVTGEFFGATQGIIRMLINGSWIVCNVTIWMVGYVEFDLPTELPVGQLLSVAIVRNDGYSVTVSGPYVYSQGESPLSGIGRGLGIVSGGLESDASGGSAPGMLITGVSPAGFSIDNIGSLSVSIWGNNEFGAEETPGNVQVSQDDGLSWVDVGSIVSWDISQIDVMLPGGEDGLVAGSVAIKVIREDLVEAILINCFYVYPASGGAGGISKGRLVNA